MYDVIRDALSTLGTYDLNKSVPEPVDQRPAYKKHLISRTCGAHRGTLSSLGEL